MLNEGMEALRQIATTSLFMQNEQKPMTNRIVPIIKEPENINGKYIFLFFLFTCNTLMQSFFNNMKNQIFHSFNYGYVIML